ncbi:transposon TX1 putative protein, partial [Trifolium medium]|nr:transposon TX1 putative protein [Trifolium medium]
MMFQRSRSRWLKEGDSNSHFFHACMKGRRSRNLISVLQVDGGWIEKPEEIRNWNVEFFKSHFKAMEWPRPNLDGLMFSVVSEEQNTGLVVPFTMEEIQSVIMECDGNKSP